MSLLATNFTLDGQTDIYRGEVRDVYTVNDKLISVATDRLAVFGKLFPEPIPHKGQVLNQLSEYFADATRDIVPNWIENTPDPNVSIGKKCKRFEVNFVIRGALIGHAWRVYESGVKTISGVEFPDGLQEYDLLEEPIITPSTKAQHGYEEDIDVAEILERGLMSEAQFERLSIVSRQLFIRGKQLARQKGLILADTKYEFGIYNDEIYVIDELHTPDNSRYFSLKDHDTYSNDRTKPIPRHMSKEYIRQWALEFGFSGLDDQVPPKMSQDFINEASKFYIEIYEQLTGNKFIYPKQGENIEKRILNNIKIALTK